MVDLETNKPQIAQDLPGLGPLLDIEDIVSAHRQSYDQLMALTFAQTDRQERDPELFAQIEELIHPLNLVWRLRFATIFESIEGNTLPWFRIKFGDGWQYTIGGTDDPLIKANVTKRKEEEMEVRIKGNQGYAGGKFRIRDKSDWFSYITRTFRISTLADHHSEMSDINVSETTVLMMPPTDRSEPQDDSLYIEGDKTLKPIKVFKHSASLTTPCVENSFALDAYKLPKNSTFPVLF